MLTVRRIAAVVLWAAGVATLLLGYGGGIAAALYLEIHAWNLIVDGMWLLGLVVGWVVVALALVLVNVITIPGVGAIHLAQRLWLGRPERTRTLRSARLESAR
jgi:hypothetical protein